MVDRRGAWNNNINGKWISIWINAVYGVVAVISALEKVFRGKHCGATKKKKHKIKSKTPHWCVSRGGSGAIYCPATFFLSLYLFLFGLRVALWFHTCELRVRASLCSRQCGIANSSSHRDTDTKSTGMQADDNETIRNGELNEWINKTRNNNHHNIIIIRRSNFIPAHTSVKLWTMAWHTSCDRVRKIDVCCEWRRRVLVAAAASVAACCV